MYLGSFNSLLIFAHCSHDITVIKTLEDLITVSKCNKQKEISILPIKMKLKYKMKTCQRIKKLVHLKEVHRHSHVNVSGREEEYFDI